MDLDLSVSGSADLLGFSNTTGNRIVRKAKMYPANSSSSSVGGNVSSMREVRDEWPDWFKLSEVCGSSKSISKCTVCQTLRHTGYNIRRPHQILLLAKNRNLWLLQDYFPLKTNSIRYLCGVVMKTSFPRIIHGLSCDPFHWLVITLTR